MLFKGFFLVSLFTAISAAPTEPRDVSSSFLMQNGLDAQKLNVQFASLAATDACTVGAEGCVQGSYAQCVGGKWTLTQCVSGTSCFALPLVNKQGTSITCDTQTDAAARIAATGAQGGVFGNGLNSTQSSVLPSSSTPLPAASSLAANGSSVPSSLSTSDCMGAESAQALPSNSLVNSSSGYPASFINLNQRGIIFAPPSTTVGSSSSVPSFTQPSFGAASTPLPGSSLSGGPQASSPAPLSSSSTSIPAASTSLPFAGSSSSGSFIPFSFLSSSNLANSAASSSTSIPAAFTSLPSAFSVPVPLSSSSTSIPAASTSLPSAGSSSSGSFIPLSSLSSSNLANSAASSSSASFPVPSGGGSSCGTTTVISTVFLTVTQFGNGPSSVPSTSIPALGSQSLLSLSSISSSGIPSAIGSSSSFSLFPGSIPGSSTSVPAGFGSSSTPTGLFPSSSVLGSSGSIFSSSIVPSSSGLNSASAFPSPGI